MDLPTSALVIFLLTYIFSLIGLVFVLVITIIARNREIYMKQITWGIGIFTHIAIFGVLFLQSFLIVIVQAIAQEGPIYGLLISRLLFEGAWIGFVAFIYRMSRRAESLPQKTLRILLICYIGACAVISAYHFIEFIVLSAIMFTWYTFLVHIAFTVLLILTMIMMILLSRDLFTLHALAPSSLEPRPSAFYAENAMSFGQPTVPAVAVPGPQKSYGGTAVADSVVP